MAKKISIAAALLLFAALAAFTAYRYFFPTQKEEKKSSAPLGEPIVNVVLPERGDIVDDRRFSGTLLPWSSFDIDPEVSGRLLNLYFDIGDTIRRGELIAKIDDVPYVQAVKEAEAGLEVARAKYREAVDLTKFYLSEFRRVEKLQANQAISYSDYEKAESNLKVQEAKKAQYEAEIKSCEAQLISAKRDLSNTTIKADWATGSELRHVGERYVDAGALLSTGKPILKIISIDKIKARIQIIERDFRFFRLGQEAEIMPDAFPGEVFRGVISMMSNELSESTRTLAAQITIPNEDYRLLPGMFIRVRIILSEHKNAQLLPPSALVNVGNRQGVFTFDPKTRVVRFVPVKIGIALRDKVEILEPELRLPIVTVGNHLLKDGSKAIVSALSQEAMNARLAGSEDQNDEAESATKRELDAKSDAKTEAQDADSTAPAMETAAAPSPSPRADGETDSEPALPQKIADSIAATPNPDVSKKPAEGDFAPIAGTNGSRAAAFASNESDPQRIDSQEKADSDVESTPNASSAEAPSGETDSKPDAAPEAEVAAA